MSYVKTGLGFDAMDYAMAPRTPRTTASAVTEEEAFLESLPKCTVNGVLSETVRQYTFPDGRKACIRDPLYQRACDSGAAAYEGRRCGNVTNTMPLLGTGRTIPGIREGYLDLILQAQADSAKQTAATRMGVQWDPDKFGRASFYDGRYPSAQTGNFYDPKHPPTKIAPQEMVQGKLYIRRFLTDKKMLGDFLTQAKGDSKKEQRLRAHIALAAYRFSSVHVVESRATSHERRSEHRAGKIDAMCAEAGIPARYFECCSAKAQERGMTAEQLKKDFEAGKLNDCLNMMEAQYNAEDAAKQRKTLLLVAGGMGVLVLAAALLKKGRK
jgi:hypothetical protein